MHWKGRAEIYVILDWHFRRNINLMNSFCTYQTFSNRGYQSKQYSSIICTLENHEYREWLIIENISSKRKDVAQRPHNH